MMSLPTGENGVNIDFWGEFQSRFRDDVASDAAGWPDIHYGVQVFQSRFRDDVASDID